MEDSLQVVYKSLADLDSFDPDLRFMALNDIYKVLQEDRGQLATQRVLQRVSAGIIKALQETNTEVQNQAVKALGALVTVQNTEIPSILSEVLASASTAKDLALRAVLTNAPRTSDSSKSVVAQLVPFVCDQLEPSIETMDVFLELVRNYGNDFSPAQIDSCLKHALGLTHDASGLVSKRAFDVILSLAPLAAKPQVDLVVSESWPESNSSQQFTVGALGLFGGLAEIVPSAIDAKLADWAISLVDLENEELVDQAEAALNFLATVTRLGLLKPARVWSLAKEALAHDPNRGDMDMDDDNDDFIDSDVEEDFDDDTEQSWRIRRASCRLVVAIRSQEFVDELVQALALELNEQVQRELLISLIALMPTPRRRGSDVSMSGSSGALGPHLAQLLQLASQHSLPEYLSLFEQVAKSYTLDQSKLIQLLLQRLKLNQTQPVLKVLQSVLEYAEVDEQAAQTIINTGLDSGQFQAQSLALACAEQLQSTQTLASIKKVAATGVGIAIRISAFDTACNIVKHHPGYVQEYVELGYQLLADQREQRTATVTSLLGLFPTKLPEQVTSKLRAQLLPLLTVTSPTLTCSCLELLSLLPAGPGAGQVLALPNDVQYLDLKCKVVAMTPGEPGVLEFAFEAAKLKDYTEVKVPRRNVEVAPLIVLFGKLATIDNTVLKRVTSQFSETPFWAEVIAEVLVATDAPSPQPSNPLSNWYVLCALFLTLRGRSIYVEDFDASQVNNVILGYYQGAMAINNAESFLASLPQNDGSTLSAIETLVMRANLSPSALEAAWAAAENHQQDPATLPILERIIGHLYALSGDSKRFSRWDNTEIGLNAAKTAFAAVKQNSQKTELLQKFISATALEDQKLKSIAAKALAWTTQIEPKIVEPWAEQILANALKVTKKDMSLVREVKIGPFTHEIDDGLDFRKASYELIYMCIYNFPRAHVSSWEPVLHGLDEKEDNDIKILTCLVLDKLDLSVLKPFLPRIYELFKTNEAIQVKETGTKLEHDRQAALVRQLTQTTKSLQEKESHGQV